MSRASRIRVWYPLRLTASIARPISAVVVTWFGKSARITGNTGRSTVVGSLTDFRSNGLASNTLQRQHWFARPATRFAGAPDDPAVDQALLAFATDGFHPGAALHDVFPIRQCNDRLPLAPSRSACVLAEMGRCLSPCDGSADATAYAAWAAADAAEARALADGDPEIVANVERLEGELAWQRGNRKAALDAFSFTLLIVCVEPRSTRSQPSKRSPMRR